ncbi:hypothetical protein [Phyllobacterium sp. 22552]|uniref:hypothetical protein n=1 Tax=Phyllobacterium sp. 22552 TaxID=3453941 RepID=UPI003F84A1F8
MIIKALTNCLSKLAAEGFWPKGHSRRWIAPVNILHYRPTFIKCIRLAYLKFSRSCGNQRRQMQSEIKILTGDPAVDPLQRTGHLIMDGPALNPKTSSTGLERWRGSDGSWSGIVNETGHLARHLPLVATLLLASLAAIALVVAVSVGIGDLSIPLSTTFFGRVNRMERTAVEINRIQKMIRNYCLKRALMADFLRCRNFPSRRDHAVTVVQSACKATCDDQCQARSPCCRRTRTFSAPLDVFGWSRTHNAAAPDAFYRARMAEKRNDR